MIREGAEKPLVDPTVDCSGATNIDFAHIAHPLQLGVQPG